MSWLRVVVACSAVSLVGGGAAVAAEQLLPDEGQIAAGVLLDGQPVGSEADGRALAEARAGELLDRRVRMVHDGNVLFEASLRELGARADVAMAAQGLEAVCRRGSLLQRLDECMRARRGKVAVALVLRIGVERVAEKLSAFKQASDRQPVAARYDFAKGAATNHRTGVVVDVYASVEAILQAARRDGAQTREVAAEVRHTVPAATRAVVAAMDRSTVVSSYETRFAFRGSEASRATNVARAATGLDGLVMMPGEVVSFNALVGPRSIDNGFAKAGEIYKGEMRMGVGGGTCQVASTFHAAAYMAGLEVVERSPHSRPSGYIGIGLDATVAYPHVDLKLRNPYDFPIVVRAQAHEGVMALELLGADHPAKVDFNASTQGIKPYKRKVKRAHWLADGHFVRKQQGIRGITVEKVRRIRYSDGSLRVEKTVDTYPPTHEVYYLAPDADEAEVLPPLPEGALSADAES